MAKKRKKSQPNYRKIRRSPRKSGRKERQNTLTSLIIACLYGSESPLSVHDIAEKVHSSNIETLRKEILDLVQKKEVTAVGKKRFRLTEDGRFLSGTLEKHPRGFGFVTNLKPKASASGLKRDPFLSINSIGSANHGDKILIRIKQIRKDNRPEAELVSVLERGRETLVGFFKNASSPFVIVEDPRYPAPIQIIDVKENIEESTVVIVQLQNARQAGEPLTGVIKEILGPPDNIDVQMRIVIENHTLPHTFAEDILTEAKKLNFSEADYSGRLDLRDTCHYTIDGETAKDFDDAVAVEKTRKGYRLYVSIADVSHFVREGTPLDKEAYLRGTSIYFPGKVIPMLPENLSNNLCSLVPYQDRLTFTAILDFDRSGTLLKKSFSKSVICSRHRFTYTTVKAILVDKAVDIRRDHKPYLTPLKWAKELAELLSAQRMKRGSIGFNIPEPEIALDPDGKIASITRKERNFAHQIIEEFMLAANEAVAALFTEKEEDFIYRIHEKPSSDKVKEFADFAESMGIDLPPSGNEPAPSWFAEVLKVVQGKPTEYVVNNLLLRTMQQARYTPDNQGHFGLAATDYTHFTSPIRRYPDLIVHRLLQQYVQKKPAKTKKQYLLDAGIHLSDRERAAIKAEREMNDRLKLFFMEHHIGKIFPAVISGLIENAIFIELLDTFVSGSIDISLLRDDYYLFDIKRYRFIGEISGKTYTLGDEIEVELIDVDYRSRRIHFAPPDHF